MDSVKATQVAQFSSPLSPSSLLLDASQIGEPGQWTSPVSNGGLKIFLQGQILGSKLRAEVLRRRKMNQGQIMIFSNPEQKGEGEENTEYPLSRM